MGKCESCPNLVKCQQKIRNMTPEEKKKLLHKLWKKKIFLKLDLHKTRMKILSIPLIPFQIVFYSLSNVIRKKQMIILMNLRLQGMKIKKMIHRIEQRKSHDYISPERKSSKKAKKR